MRTHIPREKTDTEEEKDEQSIKIEFFSIIRNGNRYYEHIIITECR
jgi:hypothetical protein